MEISKLNKLDSKLFIYKGDSKSIINEILNDKKISSMNLLILHPNYLTFHIVQLNEMKDETEYLIQKSKKNKLLWM